MWLPQLGGVARGLVYMHGQGMVHGDLKGVCLRTGVTFHLLMDLMCQGQYPYRQERPRPPGRLRPAYDHIGCYKSRIFKLVYARRHIPMDGSGTPQPPAVRL